MALGRLGNLPWGSRSRRDLRQARVLRGAGAPENRRGVPTRGVGRVEIPAATIRRAARIPVGRTVMCAGPVAPQTGFRDDAVW
ncbi:hypothetical protein B7C42_04441 [Nocardia cerradoensis]|uniref:Uncharacterized protein n=1 Tax=Nocardia cerradoensis TaxID=85688 RepID=A0A231H3T2_9NOCA|nr:hypothetical protein [Nocardia cerradoensis]OXR43573.1 hypothetical protein B7C42_04441 [Nocardia cerradoensis]